MSANADNEVDAKGIPLKSPYPEQLTVLALYSLACSIGVVIAYFTSNFTEQNAANVKISILSEYDLG